MVFIRTKKIYNQDYAYLVENEWTDKGSRQKSSKYLGKVFNIEKKSNFHRIEGLNYKEIILNLINQELKNHSSESFSFDGEKLTRGSRIAILALNEGFLCDHTVKKLLDFKPVHILKGEELANLLVETGIKLTPDQFVELCEKVFPKENKEEQDPVKPEEFYY
ncbi:hypothetical protein HY837_06630 [archaeon]|nr:hypothetical protein [archaeon]